MSRGWCHFFVDSEVRCGGTNVDCDGSGSRRDADVGSVQAAYPRRLASGRNHHYGFAGRPAGSVRCLFRRHTHALPAKPHDFHRLTLQPDHGHRSGASSHSCLQDAWRTDVGRTTGRMGSVRRQRGHVRSLWYHSDSPRHCGEESQGPKRKELHQADVQARCEYLVVDTNGDRGRTDPESGDIEVRTS
jgi:hypothetical protein